MTPTEPREPQVGDPAHEGVGGCEATDVGFYCTLPPHHDGPHAASGFREIKHVWSD